MAQVAINNNGSLPDSSAMLDVKSADKGILVPRMSSVKRDAIINPAKGLLIYCTDDNSFYVNRGTSSLPDWASMSSYWATNGTDIYYTGGNVGIGIINPTARLDVRGSNPDDGIIFQIGNSDLSHRLMLFGGRAGDPNPFIQWKQGDPLRFCTDEGGWSEKMRITGDGKVGIGTALPTAILDVKGGNNWDLVNGEGDFRLGNSLYRIKMGIALGGGGAGAAGIMQYGQPGGYNVLKLGAQGNYLLYLNGESQGVGIGTESPQASLDIQGSLRLADGSEMAGRVLTSDGDGIASWQNMYKHYIGENYGGGIVFYVYDNGQHGLIAATANQNGGGNLTWYNGTNRWTGTTGDGLGAGSMNTALIIAAQIADNPTGMYAAKACADYSVVVDGITYGDWYLPSRYELNLLYLQNAVVGGFSYDYYWSSTETAFNLTSAQFFGNGGIEDAGYKSYPNNKVRAIRAF
jgi:hypothetical protein